MTVRFGVSRWAAVVLGTGLGVTPAAESPASPASTERPNIVHIFVDDLGYGSVGFTGSPYIATPHLDALAAGGMVFHNAYASTVCGPSRANLLTGLHNGHALLDRNGNISDGFRDEAVTVGEVLRDSGYTTGVFGKWGFGGSPGNTGQELYSNTSVNVPESLPNHQGYDEFYGYLNHRVAHSYWNDAFWTTSVPRRDDGDGVLDLGEQYYPQPQSGLWAESTGNIPGNTNQNFTHDLIGRRSEQFIRDHAGDAEPFLLQVNYAIPHFDIDDVANAGVQLDLDGNVISPAGIGSYAGQFDSDKQRRFAANITRMDATVGALVHRLDDPDGDGDTSDSVLAQTVIFFTSDNGGTNVDGAPANVFQTNGDFLGGKRDLYEGGIHVPGLVYWVDETGTSRLAGSTTDRRTDLSDFIATASELAGTRAPVGVDGVSILPTLTGLGEQRPRENLLFEAFENSNFGFSRPAWTVIQNDLKLIRFNNGSTQLFDLAADPSESNNLVGENPALVAELEALALAEGAGRPDSYSVEYMRWVGFDGESFGDAAHWTGSATGTPDERWSAVLSNPHATAATVTATVAQTLGLEVRGDEAAQTLLITPHGQVTGRNEVRITEGGRIHLDDATLATARWVDVLASARLTGHGTVVGHVYNAGTLAPGRPGDLPASPAAPVGIDTGVVDAIEFDFSGVQDDAPLLSTSTLSAHLNLIAGLDFGPALSPRGAANEGDEFNFRGSSQGGTLGSAISGGHYLTFTVAPVPGLAMVLDDVTFQLRRNGDNAARDFAVLTSIDGFTDTSALDTLNLNQADTTTQTFTAAYGGGTPVEGPVEVRLYSWSAGTNNGNTHVYGVSLDAAFSSIPTAILDPTGVLRLDGDFHHLAGGAIELNLGGTDNADPLDPEYDALVVSGQAIIAGDLSLSLTDGYRPTPGDSFTVLSADSVVGVFGSLAVPEDTPAGVGWQINYSPTQVVLEAVTAMLAGDYDGDGLVAQADLDLVLLNWGVHTGVAGVPAGWEYDLPDGMVGQAELDAVLLNWGQVAGFNDSGRSIPEPTTAVGLVLSSVVWPRRLPAPLPASRVEASGLSRRPAS